MAQDLMRAGVLAAGWYGAGVSAAALGANGASLQAVAVAALIAVLVAAQRWERVG